MTRIASDDTTPTPNYAEEEERIHDLCDNVRCIEVGSRETSYVAKGNDTSTFSWTQSNCSVARNELANMLASLGKRYGIASIVCINQDLEFLLVIITRDDFETHRLALVIQIIAQGP